MEDLMALNEEFADKDDQNIDRDQVIGLFKAIYQYYKGFIAACIKDTEISVYIEDVTLMEIYPKKFFGYKCEYTVCPDGLNPGCD